MNPNGAWSEPAPGMRYVPHGLADTLMLVQKQAETHTGWMQGRRGRITARRLCGSACAGLTNLVSLQATNQVEVARLVRCIFPFRPPPPFLFSPFSTPMHRNRQVFIPVRGDWGENFSHGTNNISRGDTRLSDERFSSSSSAARGQGALPSPLPCQLPSIAELFFLPVSHHASHCCAWRQLEGKGKGQLHLHVAQRNRCRNRPELLGVSLLLPTNRHHCRRSPVIHVDRSFRKRKIREKQREGEDSILVPHVHG